MIVWMLVLHVSLSDAGPRWAYPVNVEFMQGTAQVFRSKQACERAVMSRGYEQGDVGGMERLAAGHHCEKVVVK